MTGPGGGIGDLPIGGIPVVAPITIRDEVHSGVELFHMLDRFFGGGLTAGELHAELQPVCDGPGKAQLENIRHVLNSTSSYTANHVTTELEAIEKDLFAAYQGSATGNMQSQFEKAGTMLATMSPRFSSLASGVNNTQDTLNTAWQAVKGYSRFGSDMSNLESLNPFGGGESDDDKANDAWNAAKQSLAGIGNAMASTSPDPYTNMQSTPYTPPKDTNPQANIPNPGSTGPGPGNFTPASGPGPFIPGHYPVHVHAGTPGGAGTGSPGTGLNGPGTGSNGPGYGGPGYGGPGYGGPGGSGPGAGTGPGHGPGGYGPGPGSGLDTGSDLAGAGPGPGHGFGGPGPGSGGPGFGSGDTSGLSGAGGPGAGAAAAGAGAAGAGGRGGLGAVPLGGRGGAGGGGDSDRERSTWLTEDDDVWGDSDAPDGVIS